jgi:hypothetical protein
MHALILATEFYEDSLTIALWNVRRYVAKRKKISSLDAYIVWTLGFAKNVQLGIRFPTTGSTAFTTWMDFGLGYTQDYSQS